MLKDVAPYYYEWLAHPDDGPFWEYADVEAKYDRIGVPLYLYFPQGSDLETVSILPQILLPDIVINAIEQAGSTDYDAVAKALRTKDVATPLGSIHFDDRGDATGVGFSMYQVQNGVYVELK